MFSVPDGVALILIIAPFAMFLEGDFSQKLPKHWGVTALLCGFALSMLFISDWGYSFANNAADFFVFLIMIVLLSSGLSHLIGNTQGSKRDKRILRVVAVIALFLTGTSMIPLEQAVRLGIENVDQKCETQDGVIIRFKVITTGFVDFSDFFFISKRVGAGGIFEKQVGIAENWMFIEFPENLKLDVDTLHREILIEYSLPHLVQKDTLRY